MKGMLKFVNLFHMPKKQEDFLRRGVELKEPLKPLDHDPMFEEVLKRAKAKQDEDGGKV